MCNESGSNPVASCTGASGSIHSRTSASGYRLLCSRRVLVVFIPYLDKGMV